MLDAQRSEEGLLGRAGCGKYLGSRRPCQLNGRQAHASRSRVDEDTVAVIQPGHLEGQLGADEGGGNGGQRRWANALRCWHSHLGPGDQVGAESSDAQSQHAISNLEMGDIGGHFGDTATEFIAQHRIHFHSAHADEDVGKVEARGLHRHPDLTFFERAGSCRFGVESLQALSRSGDQPPVPVPGQGNAGPAFAGPHQAGGQPVAGAPGDVVFLVGEHQLVHEVFGGRVDVRVEVDHPGLQITGFPGYRLPETPQQGTGQIGGDFPAVVPLQGLGAPGDEPHAPGRRHVAVLQGLDQGQCAGGGLLGIFCQLLGGCIDTMTCQ